MAGNHDWLFEIDSRCVINYYQGKKYREDDGTGGGTTNDYTSKYAVVINSLRLFIAMGNTSNQYGTSSVLSNYVSSLTPTNSNKQLNTELSAIICHHEQQHHPFHFHMGWNRRSSLWAHRWWTIWVENPRSSCVWWVTLASSGQCTIPTIHVTHHVDFHLHPWLHVLTKRNYLCDYSILILSWIIAPLFVYVCFQ